MMRWSRALRRRGGLQDDRQIDPRAEEIAGDGGNRSRTTVAGAAQRLAVLNPRSTIDGLLTRRIASPTRSPIRDRCTAARAADGTPAISRLRSRC